MSGPENINNTEQVKESAILANQLAGFTAHCRNGQDAPCMGACPYRLDVRGFLLKAGRGSFRAAYNILQDTLLFPKTLCSLCGHACRDACASELEGAYIDLPAIERAVIENAPNKGVKRFRVPAKDEKIAVIGAGLSGVTAAYYLNSVGYSVTLYDKADKPGGSLKDLVPEDIYLPELMSVVDAGNTELVLNKEITDLSDLYEYSGTIIATGAEGRVFGLFPGHSGIFQNGSTFVIGQAAGAPQTSSVSLGKTAGTAMDRYLKAGEIADTGAPEFLHAEACSPAALIPLRDPLDRDAAAAEAQRCRMCDCTKCVEVCELMKHYNKVPPRFEIDIPGTLNAAENIRKRSATRLLMSCDDCRMCESACPEGIRTGNALMQVRTAMAHDKVLPAAFHDFWIRDMVFSNGEEASYLRKPENGYMYFPGCLLGGSDPANVTGSYGLLEKILPGCGIFVHCCGIPAKWGGETKLLEENSDVIRRVWEKCGHPVFITACPSCKRNLKEFIPEIDVRSIYTMLAEHSELFDETILAGEELAVFHPCSGRFDPEEQQSVKALIEACGGEVKELEDASDRNGCCGYGGHIYYTNQGLYDEISKKRAGSICTCICNL